ncbi:MAG: thiamine pyrophosphate-dependent enzyme, partial [Cyclobacteriaceae bacterium]|nr:thiamine pyrophosphate-dependent enzyme [Cyclobacteriaceae bacterium]
PGALCHHDLFLGQLTSGEKAGLQPDLLITFGDSIISKQLKLFLRECPPKKHVHIQPHGDVADPFQSLTHIVRALPAQLFSALHGSRNEETFQKAWNNPETKSGTLINKFLTKGSFGEFRALGKVMEAIPAGWCTHLANSMAVRYANFLPFGNGLSVWCNRGTSGIDGSNSTAMGHAMANGKENLLITGDMAFLYDRNAFWHRHVPTNLKVIVLNNDGGGIFRMIPGPAALPELETFFETPHGFTAQNTAREAGFQYFTVQNVDELNRALPRFFNEKNRAIMEIFSDRLENTTIFATLKKEIKEALK